MQFSPSEVAWLARIPAGGGDDLTIQRILRHSNVAVTQACYIKTVPIAAKEAMQKLEAALNDTNVTPKQPLPTQKAVM